MHHVRTSAGRRQARRRPQIRPRITAVCQTGLLAAALFAGFGSTRMNLSRAHLPVAQVGSTTSATLIPAVARIRPDCDGSGGTCH
jgi:hypothetical protein